jgi:hypothetical protein
MHAMETRNETLRNNSIRWLRGEYEKVTDARRDLEVTTIISDASWYNYLKIFAYFFKAINYQGLLLCIDELVNLYKIPQSKSREKNYEQLLSFYNDINQGVAQHIGMIFGCTPQVLEDKAKGLFSYDALRTRLQESRFSKQGLRDYSGAVIRLDPLGNEDRFLLLQKLRDIHAIHYAYTSPINDGDIVQFLQLATSKVSTKSLLTPREFSRDFISILEQMRLNPGIKFRDIIADSSFQFSTSQGEDITPFAYTDDSEADELSQFAGFRI